MYGGGAHRLRRRSLGTLLEHQVRPDASATSRFTSSR